MEVELMDHQLNLLYYRTTAVALQGKNKKNGVVSHKLLIKNNTILLKLQVQAHIKICFRSGINIFRG